MEYKELLKLNRSKKEKIREMIVDLLERQNGVPLDLDSGGSDGKT